MSIFRLLRHSTGLFCVAFVWAAVFSLAATGCGKTQPQPTAEEVDYTQKLIENPSMNAPGQMMQGGSTEEQARRGAEAAGTGATIPNP